MPSVVIIGGGPGGYEAALVAQQLGAEVTVIDRDGIVRHQVVNDLPLGRNVDEVLRMVDALQFFEQHGEVCPANWSRGKAGMKATSAGVADYLARN